MLQSSDDDRTLNRRYALCVGIGTYTNLLNRNLRYTVSDAATVAERLADPRRGNFAVRVLTEPVQTTRAALEEAVEELLSAPDRQAEDLTLLYFSCHGDVNIVDNTFCLLPSNATQQAEGMFEQTTLISIYDFAKWFESAKTRNIVVLLDVCHSGGAGAALQHFKLDLAAGPNFFFIGAARQDQITRQSSVLQHGLFTHCLLRAFEQPPTEEGWLTISQIHTFVSNEIAWFAKDQPTQIQSWSVSINQNLPLLQNPGYPELCPLPPLWNVPLSRNLFFTGQDEVLSQLARLLQSKQKTALTQPYAMSGLGGIGKTQLALEYAYRHRQDYHAILWGRADTREALISTFVTIASLLDLPEKDDKDQMVIVEAVKTWLAGRSKWLFILDNADELAIVKEFIPPAFQGHLLLTTRAQVMGELARKLEVKVMQPEAGALLLLRRAGLLAPDAPFEQTSPANVTVAKELSKEMGGLPLALDQAGAYIEAASCSLQDYQRLYQIRRAELLKERGGVVPDHSESVAATWSLAFQKVEQNNPAASDLLRLCAFLYPDAIPEEIITKGNEHLGLQLQMMASDPLTLNKAITALRAYSLVSRDPDAHTLTVHRLVQAVVSDALPAEAQRQRRQQAVLAVNASFPQAEYDNWPQCERLLPHALLVTQYVETDQIIGEEAGRLLHETASYLRSRARYPEAEPLFQRALHIREQQLGPEYLDVTASLNNLALLYYNQGKYAEAEPLFQRALHVREQQLGPEHLQVAYPLNNLANLFYEQGKYAEAESFYLRMLCIFEQQLGPEHPDVAASLNNLALFYRDQGKYAEAEPLFQRALHIREQQLGPEHPQLASSLNGLATLYTKQSKYAEAEPLFQRALHIREQQLGPEHPQVAYPLFGLATLYTEQGKYAEAEPLFQRVLHIREQQLGPEHPDTAEAIYGLARFWETQGENEAASIWYARALSIREQMLGAQHPRTVETCTRLIALFHALGQHEQAAQLEMTQAKS